MVERFSPRLVAIAPDHRMRAAPFERFLRVQSGVNAAENHGRAAFARQAAKLVSAQSIAGVDSDPHHITWS